MPRHLFFLFIIITNKFRVPCIRKSHRKSVQFMIYLQLFQSQLILGKSFNQLKCSLVWYLNGQCFFDDNNLHFKRFYKKTWEACLPQIGKWFSSVNWGFRFQRTQSTCKCSLSGWNSRWVLWCFRGRVLDEVEFPWVDNLIWLLLFF